MSSKLTAETGNVFTPWMKLIILLFRNTGHDFNGRSSGASSISVWTHYLKSFEFLPEYKQGEYKGLAARVGSGLEAWELYHYMDVNNMTVVVPGGSTVGAYGGWMAGGGHSILSSTYGLGSDQPLSLQVITADGRFITADTDTNEDLYHALRGGGPGMSSLAPREPYSSVVFPLAVAHSANRDNRLIWYRNFCSCQGIPRYASNPVDT